MRDLPFICVGMEAPAASEPVAAEGSTATASAIVAFLHEHGLSIDRWACPDLSEQLRLALTRGVDVVLCNALDSEPDAPLSATLLRSCRQDVLRGLRAVAAAVRAARCLIAVGRELDPAVFPTSRRAADNPQVVRLLSSYPQSHPTLLIQTTLHRALLPGRLPTERGVLVIDAPAAFVLGRWVGGFQPVAVPLCVRDDRSAAVTLALSLPRLTVGDLLARLGLAMDRQTVLICGPKLRKQQLPREAPVGAVDPVLRVCRIVAPRASDICTRCNWCADICPVDLLPMMALEAAQFGDARAAERAGVRRCIACGLCDYVCPSRLPLMAAVQLGQAQLRAGVSGD